MDEQNSRLGVERLSGRGDEALTDLDRTVRQGRSGEAPEETAEGRMRKRSGSSPATMRTAGADRPASSASGPRPEVRTREIRAEIEQTREDMSETVNAIQDRLRPSTLASNAADSVKHAAMDKARDVADSDSVRYVRANPIPTAMIGIGVAGLAWLAMGGRDSRSDNRSRSSRATPDWRTVPAYDRPGFYEAAGTYPESGGQQDAGAAYASDAYLSDLSDSGAGLSGPGQRHAGYGYATHRATGSRARSGYSELAEYGETRMRRTWDESPLLIGAASLVLGAIVGLAIPETEPENQLMGETRDSMVHTVKETVRDKVSQVQEVATKAASTVQDAAESAVGLASTDDANKQEGGKSSRT